MAHDRLSRETDGSAGDARARRALAGVDGHLRVQAQRARGGVDEGRS